MAEIENLTIAINSSAKGALTNIDKLASSLEKLKGVLNGGSFKSARNIVNALKPLERLGNIKISSSIPKRLMEIKAASDSLAHADFSGLERLAAVLQKFKGLEGIRLPKIMPVQTSIPGAAVDESGPIDSGMVRVQASTESASFSLMDFIRHVKDMIVNNKTASAVLKGLSTAFGYVGRAARGVVGAIGGFFKSLGRVAFYRAIRAVLKDLVQGFKDLYGYSKANGTQFAKSMDMMVTSVMYLRNSIVAMVSPIVNALAPAFDYLVDRVVEALNWVNQLISALSGADTYTVARKVAVTWEDTFDSAGNSASNANNKIKELKRTILSFDEINKLNGQNTSGSSGGSGSGSSPYTNGYQTMFETRKLENKFKGFGDAVHKAFEDTFSRLGLLFEGAKLILGAILLFTGANIPLGLGLIASGAIGMANIIAEKWDGLDPKIKNTLKVLHGIVVVAELVLGAILLFTGANIPLGLGLLALGAGGLAEAIAPHWDDIVKKIKEICSNIKKAVSDWWQNTKSWFENTGEKIWTAIQDGIVKPIKNIGKWLKENVVDPFVNKVKELFGIASPSTVMKEIGGFLIDGLLGGILAGMVGIAAWIAKNVIKPIVDAFSKDDSDKEGKDFGDRLWDSIKKSWKREARDLNVTVSSSTKAQDLWDAFLLEWKGLKSNTAYFALRIANKAETLWDAFKKEWNNLTLSVYFLIKTASSANGHWDVFKKAWVGENRKVGFIITTASTANGHWDVFKKAWDGGDRKVGFIITTASSANGHWDVFKKAWDGGDRKVGFIITTASSANGHWDVFKKAWDGGDRKVGFIITTASSANGHWTTFKKAWDALENKTVNMTIAPSNTAKSLWDALVKDWNAAISGKSLTVNVSLGIEEDSSWNSTAGDLVHETFGGSSRDSSTPGGTRGGGSGRFSLGALTASVKLEPDGWSSVSDWITRNKYNNDASSVNVNLNRDTNKWWSLAEWIIRNKYNNDASSVNVDLNRDTNKWWSLADWITRNKYNNDASSVDVNLNRDTNKWWSLADWITRNKYNNDASSVNVNLSRDTNKWWSLSDWITKNKYNSDSVFQAVDLAKDGWNTVSSYVSNNMGNTVYQSVKLNIDWDDYYTNLETGTRGNPYFYHAKGGVETPHGGWSFAQGGYINYYARGTNNAHGTMFVAGEAGPEIVGHIGGRTEILNRSQLASTMFAAVRSAMTGVEIAANFYNGDAPGMSEEDMRALMDLVKAGSEAVKGQNALLKEQNEYLREIKDKEMVTEVTTAGINRAQAKANRRAGIVVG